MRALSACAFTACVISLLLPTAHDVSRARSEMVTPALPETVEPCTCHPIEGMGWRWEEVQYGFARHAGWQGLDADASKVNGSRPQSSGEISVPLRVREIWLDQGQVEGIVNRVWSLSTHLLSALRTSLLLLLSLGLLILGLFWLTYAITDETTHARILLLTIGVKSMFMSVRLITWIIDFKTLPTQVARCYIDTPLTALYPWCVTRTQTVPRCGDRWYLSTGMQHWSYYMLCVQLSLLAAGVVAYAVAPCHEKEGWAPVLVIAVMLTAVCCCLGA